MTQATLAELYQTSPQNITTHLKAIYATGELDASATCKECLHVQQEGRRPVSFLQFNEQDILTNAGQEALADDELLKKHLGGVE